jgi:hypothetical protein
VTEQKLFSWLCDYEIKGGVNAGKKFGGYLKS